MTDELQKDLEELKKDMSQFRDHMGQTLNDVGSYSRERVVETREKLNKSMKAFQGSASQKIDHANEAVHEQFEKTITSSRKCIAHNPIVAVAASFGAGILAAILMRKSHK